MTREEREELRRRIDQEKRKTLSFDKSGRLFEPYGRPRMRRTPITQA